MRDTERKLEMRGKKKGGSKWEKIGWDEDKKICPFDAKKVCPVTKSPVFMRVFRHSDRPENHLEYCCSSNKHPVFD